MSHSKTLGKKQNVVFTFLTGNLVWIVLIALVLFALFAIPIFRHPLNLTNVLKQSIGLGITALGQTFAVLGGGIDLSIGSMISLMTTLIAGTFKSHPETPMWLIIMIILALGTLLGMINALIIVKLKVTPFITTLGTMSVFQGIVLFYSKIPLGGVSKRFRFIADGRLSVFPFSVLLFLILIIGCYLILNFHKIGRHIYAVGSNEYVARLSGIAVSRVKFFAYTICGLLAAVASIYLAARMAGGGPRIGTGYELDSITAIVIGGISLAGGTGSIVGGFGGVLILTIFNNIMNLLDVNPYYQIVLKGSLLILAVSLYKNRK